MRQTSAKNAHFVSFWQRRILFLPTDLDPQPPVNTKSNAARLLPASEMSQDSFKVACCVFFLSIFLVGVDLSVVERDLLQDPNVDCPVLQIEGAIPVSLCLANLRQREPSAPLAFGASRAAPVVCAPA